MNANPTHQQLIDPFEDCDVEWRVQQSSVSAKGSPWVMVIPYVTNRAIQQRLDEAFGFEGWKNEYKETADKKGYLCGISFKSESGEWITKWDGSEYSNIEPLKGALSGSMKRAAVHLGIGRYLYNLSEEFATCEICDNRFTVKDPWQYIYIKPNAKKNQKFQAVGAKWLPPILPDWAQPSFKSGKYLVEIKQSKTIEDLQVVFNEATNYAKSFNKGSLAKQIIAAKDEKKFELETAQSNTTESKSKELMSWLNGKIVDLVSEAPNESVVKQVKSNLKSAVEKSCSAVSIDPTVYLARIDNSCKERISQLTNTAAV